MFLALKRSTIALAVGLLRGSGPKVNSVPSAAGPVIEANSLSLMASPRHQHRLEALVAHLAHDEAGFLVIAAHVNQIDIVALQARDDSIKILVALVVALEHLLGDAGLVQRLPGLVGEAFSIGRLVVQDRDILALVVLGNVLAGDKTLLVVAAADAQHIGELAFGEQRIGRARRDLQHIAVGIGLRCRDRRRRTIVTGDERNARAGEFLGNRARLLGIAGVIADL